MWFLSVGDVLAGRYRIQKELGVGGMAYVFAALDIELNEPVAIKVIKPDFVDDKDFVERFKREVRIARQIRHPNIIQVLEFGHAEMRDKRLYYLTMELLEGRDLSTWLKERDEIALADTVRIGLQVCDALSAAHRFGVVHRDIKPQNIFIESDGRVKLMDFGISRLPTLPSVTTGGQLIGTPKYMSPEQVHRKTEPDHRSDIYALGIVLYELSTRQTPFEGQSTVEIALKHVQEEPVHPRELNAQLPAEFERVVLKCLEKDPNARYASAEALREDLQAVPTSVEARVEEGATEILNMQPTEKTKLEAPTAIPTKRRGSAGTRSGAGARPSTHPRPGTRSTIRRPAPLYKRRPIPFALGSIAVAAGVVYLALSLFSLSGPTTTVDDARDSEAVGLLDPIESDSGGAGASEPTEAPEPTEAQDLGVGGVATEEGGASQSTTAASTSGVEPGAAASSTGSSGTASTESPTPTTTSGGETVASETATRLTIRSEPDGARVRVDGRDVGRTPWVGPVAPGRRRVTLSADGYVTSQDVVDVSEGESVTRRVQLAPLVRSATVRFSANPGTDIYVDGELLGRIPPLVEHELDVGAHVVRYVMPDYSEHEERIQVEARDGQEFSHTFPVPGAVRISAQPYARVFLDGKDLGFTPVSVEKVAEGEHSLVLEREGFERIEETITIRPFEINRFQYTMVRQ